MNKKLELVNIKCNGSDKTMLYIYFEYVTVRDRGLYVLVWIPMMLNNESCKCILYFKREWINPLIINEQSC